MKVKVGDVIKYVSSGSIFVVIKNNAGMWRRVPAHSHADGTVAMTRVAEYVILYNIFDIIQEVDKKCG